MNQATERECFSAASKDGSTASDKMFPLEQRTSNFLTIRSYKTCCVIIFHKYRNNIFIREEFNVVST